MSAGPDKIIISAEVAGRKKILGAIEVTMNARMDESINQGMQRCGQKLLIEMLEAVDKRFQQTKAREWENRGRKKRQIVTSIGWVPFKRRVYKDSEGHWRRPLDEMLELKPKRHYTQSVKEKVGYLVSELAYRKAGSVMGWLVGTDISHTTMGRLMQEVGQSLEAEEDEQRERVFEQGEELEAEKSSKKQKYGWGSSTQVKK